jgi:hypothetical protein
VTKLETLFELHLDVFLEAFSFNNNKIINWSKLNFQKLSLPHITQMASASNKGNEKCKNGIKDKGGNKSLQQQCGPKSLLQLCFSKSLL